MGFFSDLKEDLAMAVNEMMPDETAEEMIHAPEMTEEVQQDNSDVVAMEEELVSAEDFELDKMLENLETLELNLPQEDVVIEEAEAEVAVEEEMAEEQENAMEEEIAEAETVEEPVEETAEESAEEVEEVEEIEEVAYEENTEELVVEDEEEPETTDLDETAILVALEQEDNNTQDEGTEKKMETMTNRVASDETAVITQGMIITGDIISEGSVDVIGTISGNIDILGKLNVTGSIQGNSKASEIFADNAKINGEVVADGSVKIGQSSIIIGNITATSAVIAGAVKGDIDVHGPVILDTSAIVMGNIKSKSVQINNGAVIEGMCSQCYADVNPTSFFEELKNNK